MLNRTKIAILSAVTNMVWFILTYIWNRQRIAPIGGEELAKAWGVYLLVLVVGFLVLDALSAILIMTIEKRAGGQGFEEKTDERDRYIEGYAAKTFRWVFFLSFLVALVLLAMGLGFRTFFYARAFTVLLADLGMWITYIIGYERGL